MRGNSCTVVVLASPAPGEVLGAIARSMWDVARPQGPDELELAAAQALSAWRAGQFELPDYYLALAAATGPGSGSAADRCPSQGARATARPGPPPSHPAGAGIRESCASRCA